MTPTKIRLAQALFFVFLIIAIRVSYLSTGIFFLVWLISGVAAFLIHSNGKIHKLHSGIWLLLGLTAIFGLISLGGIAFVSSMERARSLEKLRRH